MVRKDKLGVAVLGHGFMGGMHLEGWKLMEDCEIKGIWSKNYSHARAAAKKLKVGSYEKLQEVLDDDGVDIVDICTPSFTHADYSVSVMKAGKHVLVEKPMALSLKEADGMIDSSKDNRVKLMVAHVLRFFPEYAKTKAIIDQGMIGEPVIARAYRAGAIPDWNSWFQDFEKSGGVAIDLAIHDIDFLMWCFDAPVIRVYAKVERLVHKKITAHDFALINMRFEGGGIALVEASEAVPKQFPFTMKLNIDGTKGTVQLDNQTPVPVKLILNDRIQGFSPESLPWKPSVHPFPVDPFYREIRHFVNCLRENTKPLTDGESSRKSLEVAIAALKSAKRRAPVDLPLDGP
jgi:predicted dehydrogenase